jgi:hypothetical protein
MAHSVLSLLPVIVQDEPELATISTICYQPTEEGLRILFEYLSDRFGFRATAYDRILAVEKGFGRQTVVLFTTRDLSLLKGPDRQSTLFMQQLRQAIARSTCPCITDKMSLHLSVHELDGRPIDPAVGPSTGEGIIFGFAVKPA